MSDQDIKNIVMIGCRNNCEALRMASGLTLLDDHVQVYTLSNLIRDDMVDEQLDALEFADVPVNENAAESCFDALADTIYESDVVFCI